LNQTQIVDQLEMLAYSNGLTIFKTPSEEDVSAVRVFLNAEDFFFEIFVNATGQIVDVKYSIFKESAKVTIKKVL
jgi:hypothetical protein